MNEKMLLQLLVSDPEKGLAAVVGEYSTYVYKIALTKLSDVCTKEDIEEAVSDIFLKFYLSGKECGFNIRSLKGYLSVIAARHCVDVFRKKCREEQTLDFSELENIIAEFDITDGGYLINAVKSLGEPDSSIIIRKYYFGQKNKDIAKETGLRQGTVNTRISRALVKLRKMLEEDML